MGAAKQFNTPRGKTKDWKKRRVAPAFGQGKHAGTKVQQRKKKKRTKN